MARVECGLEVPRVNLFQFLANVSGESASDKTRPRAEVAVSELYHGASCHLHL